MDFLRLSLFLLLLSGCTTGSYLVKQGWGQLKISMSGTTNDKVMSDPAISDEVKFKIRLIEDAKAFFSHYFAHDAGDIYSKTIFLDSKAVSWLVIASRPEEIKAHEYEFPFMGAFPYIGFFQKSDAEDFKSDLEEDGFVTFMRPVFAYSTLGYLEDRILSSFFEYDEVELVELVFHELFHTLFFVKNQVELNENLASFFADRLLDEYYKDNPTLKMYRRDQVERRLLEKKLVSYAKELRREFDKMRPNLNAEKANLHTQRFVRELLVPAIKESCQKQGWLGDDCPDKEEKWNQARLAAMLTYEEEQDFLTDLSAKHPSTLKQFLEQLRSWYKQWDASDKKLEFTDYLKQMAML